MPKNYKFFQHTECEYFPCHSFENKADFNCLFCYCPLYMLKDKCGGNFIYTNNVKDCSNCILPHTKKAFEFVKSKMSRVIKIGSEQK